MKFVFYTYFLCLAVNVNSQTKLPLIHATSKIVSIKDGNYLSKNSWTLSPEVKLDVYNADRCKNTKTVSFYTDTDSITATIKPNDQFNFIILLNNKDTCFTQIASTTPQHNLNTFNNDTIPFTITNDDAIMVYGLLNNKDTILLHFDLGTTDIKITKDALQNKLNSNDLNSIKSIKIGNSIYNSNQVKIANVAAKKMDGRFGWRIFDGKIIILDYNHQYIIVQKKLPLIKKSFQKMPIHFLQNLFCASGSIHINKVKITGDFLFDTGSNLSVILDSTWMKENSFPNNLPTLKTTKFLDGAGRTYSSKSVLIPKVVIGNKKSVNVPTVLLGYNSPVGENINMFGNAFLKKFNMIIDLQNDELYLDNNRLF